MTKRVLGITVAAAMLAAVPAAQAAPQTASFGVTGGDQMFTVPAGVTSVHVVAIGGSGGSTAAATGGTGARLTADVPVQGGQVLYVEVGANVQPGQIVWIVAEPRWGNSTMWSIANSSAGTSGSRR